MTDSTDHRPTPRITVIMVDGSFRERYHTVDFLVDQTLGRDDYEVLWVEYYDRLHPALARRLERQPNFRAICLGREGTYHASYCFNRGITEARGELLVIPDADVVVERDFLERVLTDHERCDELVEYFYRYNEREQDHREPIELDHLRRVCTLTNPSNHGACLSVRRKWLLAINGYDQHPIFAGGFHCNDLDVYSRLKALGLLVRWSPDIRLYHPWHPMTGVYDTNYLPQQAMINHRAQAVEFRPLRGIDPRFDREPPEEIARYAEWIRTKNLPLPQRIAHKVRKHLGRRAA